MTANGLKSRDIVHTETMMGHPKALFLLFAVEMWERFFYTA